MGMSAAHCEGNVREFQSVRRVVTLLMSSCVIGQSGRSCLVTVDIVTATSVGRHGDLAAAAAHRWWYNRVDFVQLANFYL